MDAEKTTESSAGGEGSLVDAAGEAPAAADGAAAATPVASAAAAASTSEEAAEEEKEKAEGEALADDPSIYVLVTKDGRKFNCKVYGDPVDAFVQIDATHTVPFNDPM